MNAFRGFLIPPALPVVDDCVVVSQYSSKTLELAVSESAKAVGSSCGYTVEPKMESKEDMSSGTVCETVVEIEDVCRFDMHAVMEFVDTCNLFHSSITARRGINSADGKSIMQMSTLAATCGSKLRISAEGVDAQEAITALQDIIEKIARGESSQRK